MRSSTRRVSSSTDIVRDETASCMIGVASASAFSTVGASSFSGRRRSTRATASRMSLAATLRSVLLVNSIVMREEP